MEKKTKGDHSNPRNQRFLMKIKKRRRNYMKIFIFSIKLINNINEKQPSKLKTERDQ